MRVSRSFMPLLRETPAEAQIVLHRYMLRAGLVRQASAGIYSWLPLGHRVLRKIEQIVREEQVIDNSVYYMKRGNGDEATALKLFDLKDKKETDLGEIDGYEIGNNSKKMLVRKAKGYYIIDLPKGKLDLKESINTSDVKVLVDRKAEWKQIFDESWRQMRYFFYDSNMHGVDWPAMKAKYEVLLPYVNHRADLSYIIGEMIGELSIGHAYVGGCDLPKAERIQLGLLGADLLREANGYYRIAKILKGENWTGNLRCPLTDIGVNAIEGDYIVAVNGMPTNTLNDINVAFVNTVGKQVESSRPAFAQWKGSDAASATPPQPEHTKAYEVTTRRATHPTRH